MAPSRGKPVSAILVLAEGKDVENIWVRKIRSNQYEVRTIPFWAYNLSMGDVVACGPDEDGEGLFVQRVLKKSGNRTVRVGFKGSLAARHPDAVNFRDYLRRERLDWEFAEPNLFAISLPSEAAYKALLDRLRQIGPAAKMIWEDGDPQPGVNMDGSDEVAAARHPKKRSSRH